MWVVGLVMNVGIGVVCGCVDVICSINIVLGGVGIVAVMLL